jgi:hypothetical protein
MNQGPGPNSQAPGPWTLCRRDVRKRMSDVQHALSQGRGPRHEFTSLGSVTSENQFDDSFKMHLTHPDGFLYARPTRVSRTGTTRCARMRVAVAPPPRALLRRAVTPG